MKSIHWKFVVLAGVFLLASGLTLHLLPYIPILSYTIVAIASGGLFILFAFILLRSTTLPGRWLLLLLGAAGLVRASFLFSPAIGSDDIYRYLWDGKVQSSGINPYRFTPDDTALAALHTPDLPARVNHPDMTSLYFPFSEWVFFTAYALSGESVWGLKLLLLLSECLTVFGIILLLRQHQLPERAVLLYALSPLPLLVFGVDAHLDGFGIPLLVFSLWFWGKDQRFMSLLALGLSLSIKLTGLVFLPLLFFQKQSLRQRVLVLVVPGAVLLVQCVPYFGSGTPFAALGMFARDWVFNGAAFELINSMVGDNQTARLACGVMYAIILVSLALWKSPLLVKTYYAVLLLLLFSPVVHPWYVAWLGCLIPLTPRWSGIFFSATASLTSFTVLHYVTTGVWVQYPWVMAVEYVPVVMLLMWENRPLGVFRPLPQSPSPDRGGGSGVRSD
jgi:alpha-1,6-mannosyltransferase